MAQPTPTPTYRPSPDRSQVHWFDDQDSELYISYSGLWRLIPWEGAYASTIHWTKEVGAFATFQFPGPAYVFANITWPACEGSGYTIRGFVHGYDYNQSGTSLSCNGRRNDINMLEFYMNEINVPGTQRLTIELVSGGPGDVALMLDGFGYLPIGDAAATSISHSIITRTSSSSSLETTKAPTTSSTSDSPISSAIDVQTVVPGSSPSTPLIVALGVAAGFLFVLGLSLFFFRRRVRGLLQRLRSTQSGKPSRDMEEKPHASTFLNAPYVTLQPSSSALGLLNPKDSPTRSKSPNSLFDDTGSTATTPTINTPYPDRSQAFWSDDTNPDIVYAGTWSAVHRPGAWFASLHSTKKAGSSATFSFPGPSYVFINISLPVCDTDGFLLRAFVHGLEGSESSKTVACASRNEQPLLEFYNSLVDRDGLQQVTIELMEDYNGSAEGRGPLLLDCFGYVTLADLRNTPFISNSSETLAAPTISVEADVTVTVVPASTTSVIDIPLNTDNMDAVTTTVAPTVGKSMPFSVPVLIGLSLAIGMAFIVLFILFAWRHRIRNFIQQKKQQHSNNSSEVDMTERLNHSTFSTNARFDPMPPSPSRHGLLDSDSNLDRPSSPNSLFHDTMSRTSTIHCIVGDNPKFGECYCPTCDVTRSNPNRQSSSSSSTQMHSLTGPTSYSAHSDAQSSITAVGTNTSYRASSSSSHTAASTNSNHSNPFTDERDSFIHPHQTLDSHTRNPFGED
ncbi:hypothetical protein CVT24_010148 [Panaeolus cyanescens]|uniref:Uncharacterized protein n=1 Tax=Panaeolus cyanescens TaxID=181874 RepID=A0A409W978_9AGAR|nr:hypothetical protein CVT24_010148 [Panaeolus cyanescens]